MAAYRQVYDSHHLQADCQEPGSAPELYATFFYFATCSNLRQVFTRIWRDGRLGESDWSSPLCEPPLATSQRFNVCWVFLLVHVTKPWSILYIHYTCVLSNFCWWPPGDLVFTWGWNCETRLDTTALSWTNPEPDLSNVSYRSMRYDTIRDELV